MSKFTRLLVPLISLLLLLIVGIEVYYLFFYQSKKTVRTPIQTTQPQISPRTTPPLNPLTSSQTKYFQVTNSAIVSSIRTFVVEGKITSIDTKGGIDPSVSSQYDAKIMVKGKGPNPYPLIFTKDEIDRIKLVQKVDEKEEPITFTSLKVGDSIIAEFKLDELKRISDNLIEGKIIKL